MFTKEFHELFIKLIRRMPVIGFIYKFFEKNFEESANKATKKKEKSMEPFSGDIYNLHSRKAFSKKNIKAKDEGKLEKTKSKWTNVNTVDKNGMETSQRKKVNRLERLLNIRTKIRLMPITKQLSHKKLLMTLDSEILKSLKKKNSNG